MTETVVKKKPNKTLVLAFPGSGKTHMANAYANVDDHDSPFYHLPSLKKDIEASDKDVVVVPLVGMPEWYDGVGDLNVIIATPEPSCVGEYLDRYKNRKTPDHIGERFAKEIPMMYHKVDRLHRFKHKKLFLKPKQFLADALKEHGVHLEPKEKD